MRDKSDYAIGVLSITAVILLVGLLLITSASGNRAAANSMLDRGGDYIMATGQFSESDEVIYVTDTAAQRLALYSYDPTHRQFMLWDVFDLRQLPAP